MNSGMHSPTPTQTCTFPVYWLFSALPISHTILGTNIGIIVEYVMKKKTYGNAYIDTPEYSGKCNAKYGPQPVLKPQ